MPVKSKSKKRRFASLVHQRWKSTPDRDRTDAVDGEDTRNGTAHGHDTDHGDGTPTRTSASFKKLGYVIAQCIIRESPMKTTDELAGYRLHYVVNEHRTL